MEANPAAGREVRRGLRGARSVAGLLLMAAPGIPAQDTTGIGIGSRVRIEATHRVNDAPVRYVVVGDLTGYDDRQMWVSRPGGRAVDTIPMALVVSAMVSREHKTMVQSVTRGALIGAALGAVYYGVFNGLTRQVNQSREDRENDLPLSEKIAKLAIPIGAVAGGAFGAANRGEQWLRFGVPGALAGR